MLGATPTPTAHPGAEHAARRPRAMLRRVATAVAAGVAIVYALVVAASALFYRRLLYPAPPPRPHGAAEGSHALEAPTADGARVRGMLFDGPPGAPLVVCFHGNGETMEDAVWVAGELRRRGLGVALIEYRGYGVSRGEPSPTESGLYADGAAALDALAAAGYGPERVVLWGQALGTGVAAEMAWRGRAAALVLVSPYTSIVDMARRFAPPAIPVSLIVGDRYDTLEKASRIGVPALVVHGDADELIPHEMGVEVTRALPRATLYTVHGGHHGDVVGAGGAALFDAVARLAGALTPAALAERGAVTAPSAPAVARAPAPPAPHASVAPATISCQSIDDCWLDGDDHPIPRPAQLRGAPWPSRYPGAPFPWCSFGKCSQGRTGF